MTRLVLVLCLVLFVAPALAQDKKISELPDGSPGQATDAIPIARAGANFRLPFSSFAFVQQGWTPAIAVRSDSVGYSSFTFDPGLIGVRAAMLWVRSATGSVDEIWAQIPFSISGGMLYSTGTPIHFRGAVVSLAPTLDNGLTPISGTGTFVMLSGSGPVWPVEYKIEWLDGTATVSPGADVGGIAVTLDTCPPAEVANVRTCEVTAGVPIRDNDVSCDTPYLYKVVVPGSYRVDAQHWTSRAWNKEESITVTRGVNVSRTVTMSDFLANDLRTLACAVP